MKIISTRDIFKSIPIDFNSIFNGNDLIEKIFELQNNFKKEIELKKSNYYNTNEISITDDSFNDSKIENNNNKIVTFKNIQNVFNISNNFNFDFSDTSNNNNNNDISNNNNNNFNNNFNNDNNNNNNNNNINNNNIINNNINTNYNKANLKIENKEEDKKALKRKSFLSKNNFPIPTTRRSSNNSNNINNNNILKNDNKPSNDESQIISYLDQPNKYI
jgi:hypothetical protein